MASVLRRLRWSWPTPRSARRGRTTLSRFPERDRWINDQRQWLFQRALSCFATEKNAVSQTWRTAAVNCLSDMYRRRKDQFARGEFFIEHGTTKGPFANIYAWPDSDKLNVPTSRWNFFKNPEIRILPDSYTEAAPRNLNWVPEKFYDSQDNDVINIWSENARIFLISQGRTYYWLEREFDVNGEIRVFIPSAAKDIYNPRVGFDKHELISGSSDVCYISPNIQHR
jgi:hypothetical protein